MRRVAGRLAPRLCDVPASRARGAARTGDGFVALGVTYLTYALTELAHGYGFVGVFVAALTFRGSEREHRYHIELHAFAEQVERLI